MKTTVRRVLIVLGGALLLFVVGSPARAQLPTVDSPVIIVNGSNYDAVVKPRGRSLVTVQVKGSNLGDRSENSKAQLILRCTHPDGKIRRYKVSARRSDYRQMKNDIFRWTDSHIVVWLRTRDVCIDGQLTLQNNVGRLPDRQIELVFQYDRFPLPPDSDAAALPLAITQDSNKDIWMGLEFSTRFHVWRAATESFETIVPITDNEAPFGKCGTTCSTSEVTPVADAEDVLLVPAAPTRPASVWFGQSGSWNYVGATPSRSRLVSYNGTNLTKYDLPNGMNPWDKKPIVGLAYDSEKIWFSTGDFLNRLDSRISSFDLNTTLVVSYPVAGAGLPSNILPTGLPAHIVVTAGYVWFEAFLGGNFIGRLDPTDGGAVKYYPVPLVRSFRPDFTGVAGWSLFVDSETGDLIFSESMEAAVGRFHIDRISSLGCESLVAGKNPCMDIFNVPVDGDAPSAFHWVHSAAISNAYDEVWYTYASDKPGLDSTDQIQSVGYVCDGLGATAAAVTLPPLYASIPDYREQMVTRNINVSSFAGIVVDDDNDAIWIAGYGARDLGRLTRLKSDFICP